MNNATTSDETHVKTTTFTDVEGEESVGNGDEPTQQKRRSKKYKQNWRINLLSEPRRRNEKYKPPPDEFSSGVSPDALKAETPERVEHMSRPPLRLLVVNKREHKDLYEDYEPKMDQKIEYSLDSMYNSYKKAKRDKKAKEAAARPKRKRSTSSTASRRGSKDSKTSRDSKTSKKSKGDKKEKDAKGKKGKKGVEKAPEEEKEEEREKEREEWLEKRSKPKKVAEPEPIPRGPTADLIEMKSKIDLLATPKKVQLVEEKDLTKIPEAALTYTATDRIMELARPATYRLVKEESPVPGAVKPEALTYIASERVKELATPKVTQSVNDTDVKEDPFAISANALKYVATERIRELAKPVER